MKRKKSLSLAAILTAALVFSQCILVNELGISDTHVRGREAKIIIREKTTINALLLFAVGTSAGVIQGFGAYTQPDILGISDNSWYKRTEVEACADTLLAANLILNPIINVVWACNLQVADPITGN